jgi:glutathione synthase/RimK-type ligase-like ATP-grasp enzyme
MSDLVLLCGIPTESPLAVAANRLAQLGVPHVVLSQRAFERAPFWYGIESGRLVGRLHVDGVDYPLDAFSSAYLRLMDDQQLPEVAAEPPGSARCRHARSWHDAILRWCEISPMRVVNRMAAMASNCSKPFQAQVILRHGFRTPETLITSDPDAVREFSARIGRVVFKSISGIRSIVRELEAADLQQLDRIRWCPVQFQAFVDGRNIRVHTVGSQVFATAISTDATDYRYAQRQSGEPADLTAVELTDEVADRCVALASDLRLPFAGIDLKVTPDGDVYCFEVNPSPAYAYYEAQTGQPISTALARYLAGLT